MSCDRPCPGPVLRLHPLIRSIPQLLGKLSLLNDSRVLSTFFLSHGGLPPSARYLARTATPEELSHRLPSAVTTCPATTRKRLRFSFASPFGSAPKATDGLWTLPGPCAPRLRTESEGSDQLEVAWRVNFHPHSIVHMVIQFRVWNRIGALDARHSQFATA